MELHVKIICELYLLCFVLFVLCLCIVSFMYIIFFVCTNVRTTATERKLNCSNNNNNNNNNKTDARNEPYLLINSLQNIRNFQKSLSFNNVEELIL